MAKFVLAKEKVETEFKLKLEKLQFVHFCVFPICEESLSWYWSLIEELRLGGQRRVEDSLVALTCPMPPLAAPRRALTGRKSLCLSTTGGYYRLQGAPASAVTV